MRAFKSSKVFVFSQAFFPKIIMRIPIFHQWDFPEVYGQLVRDVEDVAESVVGHVGIPKLKDELHFDFTGHKL